MCGVWTAQGSVGGIARCNDAAGVWAQGSGVWGALGHVMSSVCERCMDLGANEKVLKLGTPLLLGILLRIQLDRLRGLLQLGLLLPNVLVSRVEVPRPPAFDGNSQRGEINPAEC